MTDQDIPSDGDQVLTLQQLIKIRMDERGWSYAELARRTNGEVSKPRLQQIGGGRRLREFPEPATLVAMAEALEVDPTTVVLAVARSLGIEVRARGSELAELLPAGVRNLSPAMRDAILAVARAAVADQARGEDDVDGADSLDAGGYQTVELPPFPSVVGRNTVRRRSESGR